ncbi:MAG TPA: carbon starvation CstA family protein, partial [bacterium]|nr:carbon starvation CstA family protein [bacterium]
MNSVWILAAALILYVFGYRLYGKLLSRTFDVDAKRVTPAHSLKDGVDFVPAKNWLVLFGHHFSSICGAGPIIGPVLACAYWGWGVSFVWIIAGALLMGAVSDFSSLVMSVRSSGQSIAQIAGAEISRRTRLYFSFFLLISLILVIAVFSIFAAKTFIAEPDAVIPSVGLIPTAVFVGWLLYVRKASGAVSTVAGLAILCFLLYAGQRLPVSLPAA